MICGDLLNEIIFCTSFQRFIWNFYVKWLKKENKINCKISALNIRNVINVQNAKIISKETYI